MVEDERAFVVGIGGVDWGGLKHLSFFSGVFCVWLLVLGSYNKYTRITITRINHNNVLMKL